MRDARERGRKESRVLRGWGERQRRVEREAPRIASPWWALLALLLGATLPGADLVHAQAFPVSSALPAESRQFDFWVGAWSVNLRVLQADLTWRDQHTSVAHIYPILNGKAVLELWDENRVDGITGYSLRYFDTARGEWVLWLNWPGPNRSGSSSLAGSFRHGRGEFFSTSTAPDGSETLSRYTFSDIKPESLRWDDAFSSDGGATWRHSWIMEFRRTEDRVVLPPDGGAVHTFRDGGRCDEPEFRRYEFLEGRKDGEVVAGGRGPVTITGYRILDGCAVMTFAGPGSDPESAWGFSHLTFNTYARRYELTTLTSQPRTPARVFYSPPDQDAGHASGGSSVLVLYEADRGDGPRDRFRIEEADDGSVLWIHETPAGDGWAPVWGGRVR